MKLFNTCCLRLKPHRIGKTLGQMGGSGISSAGISEMSASPQRAFPLEMTHLRRVGRSATEHSITRDRPVGIRRRSLIRLSRGFHGTW